MIWNETFEGNKPTVHQAAIDALMRDKIRTSAAIAAYAVSQLPDTLVLRWRLTITLDGVDTSTAEQGSQYVAVHYKLLK